MFNFLEMTGVKYLLSNLQSLQIPLNTKKEGIESAIKIMEQQAEKASTPNEKKQFRNAVVDLTVISNKLENNLPTPKKLIQLTQTAFSTVKSNKNTFDGLQKLKSALKNTWRLPGKELTTIVEKHCRSIETNKQEAIKKEMNEILEQHACFLSRMTSLQGQCQDSQDEDDTQQIINNIIERLENLQKMIANEIPQTVSAETVQKPLECTSTLQHHENMFAEMQDLITTFRRKQSFPKEKLKTISEKRFQSTQANKQDPIKQEIDDILTMHDLLIHLLRSFKGKSLDSQDLKNKQNFINTIRKRLENLQSMVLLDEISTQMPLTADKVKVWRILGIKWRAMQDPKPQGIYTFHLDQNDLFLTSRSGEGRSHSWKFHFSKEKTVIYVNQKGQEVDSKLDLKKFKQKCGIDTFKYVEC